MNIMNKFYINGKVASVRLEALNQLKNIITQHLLCYEVITHSHVHVICIILYLYLVGL